MCKNPNVDLVNMNDYIKFDENMSVSSQDIARKRNFGVNQRAITQVLMRENGV